MAGKETKLNVQIIDEKLGRQLKLFPTTYTWDVIVREDPLMTLDEWLRDQEELNQRFLKAVNKVNALEKASNVYVSSVEKPNPNPVKSMLWAHLLDEVDPLPTNACNCDEFRSTIDVLKHEPANPKEGYMWTVSETGRTPTVTSSGAGSGCDCEDHRSRVDILEKEPTNPHDGYMWVVRDKG